MNPYRYHKHKGHKKKHHVLDVKARRVGNEWYYLILGCRVNDKNGWLNRHLKERLVSPTS